MLVPVGVVSDLKFLCKVFNAQTLTCEQDYEMINHVSSFVDEASISAVASLNNCLKSLFSNLLCHSVNAILEQGGSIAALGHFLVAGVDEILQISEEE